MIELKNVTKIYNPKKGSKTVALDNVSFKLPSKGLIFVLGKSGSGKSTLLNILGLLDKPDDGEVLINNKPTRRLKEKDITNYRSNHIGFVFQEFNLLDELNIYDNIDIALNLKGVKSNREDIDKILVKVGLDNLGKRTTGELSGGEKQRVAIARALVKDPTIILADEPTGNLDYTNSQMVFDILKDISKDHLVVVVTHDIDFAKLYADGIIEIKDGKIINDSVTNFVNDDYNELEFKKSHIRFLKRMKLSFGFIKRKKIRLAFTAIIASIAFALFGFSMSLFYFDIPKMHADTMIHENEDAVTINKNGAINFAGYSLFDNDVLEITKKLNSNYIKISDVDGFSDIDFDYEYAEQYLDKAFYEIDYFDEIEFLTYSDNALNELDIIGNIPTKEREILISEILAEYIIEKGAGRYDPSASFPRKPLNPENKEELVGQNIIVGNTYLIISGIIKDPKLAKYNSLKEESANKMRQEPTDLYQEFRDIYKATFYDFVVNENFFDVTNFAKRLNLDSSMYKIVVDYNDKKYYSFLNNWIVDDEITYHNGITVTTTDKLNPGEIILSTYGLSMLYTEDYNNISAEERKKMNDSGEECSTDELHERIIARFLKQHNIIGKTISYEITDLYGYTNNPKVNKMNFKIVGINLTNDYDYFSNELESYILPRNLVKKIQITETDEEKLENIFRDFSSLDKYQVETRFSNKINDIEKVVTSIEKIAKYIALGFMIFAIIILTIFLTNSISVNSKKIGILRALGARVKDIIRIFMLEGLIIGGITFILANILSFIGIYYTNIFITKEMYFYVRPLVFDIKIFLMILLVVVITIIVSLIIPVIKLAKTKPISLINKK